MSALFAVSLTYPLARLINRDLIPDFTMLWTGGYFALRQPHLLYDADAITAAQSWVRNTTLGPLPFVYPPTALPLIAPFALLPLWVAYGAWTLLGGAAFWSGARRVAKGWAVPLSFASPHVIFVLLIGQTTLWVGAAILWGLSLLQSRPFLGGVFFGLAAAIKPQSVFLAPIAFVSGGHWRAIAGAAAAWCAIALLSLAFGAHLWVDWLRDIQTFDQTITHWHLDYYGATPLMLGRALGLGPSNLLLLQCLGLAAGVYAIWRAFRSDDLNFRALAFIGGCMLASPYAMRYELAMLAPVLMAGALSGTARGMLTASPLFALNVFTVIPALIVSLFASRDRVESARRIEV